MSRIQTITVEIEGKTITLKLLGGKTLVVSSGDEGNIAVYLGQNVRIFAPETAPIIERPVEELGLTASQVRNLESYGIKTVKDFCKMTESRFLQTRGFIGNKRALKDLQEVLAQHGLCMGMKFPV